MPRCPTCQAELAPKTSICPHDGTAIPAGLEGEVLGERYRVIRELGEGGMGRVYLAEHVILGKQVAVKVLREEYSRLPDLVKRFQLEAVAASQVGQENIVDVTDFGKTADGSFYFVMEYVPGKSLAQIIDGSGPLKPARAMGVLLQISKALSAAHSRGIVHRDLKPDNVLVSRKPDGSEHAKVLDFGISKVGEGNGGPRITQVGMVVGTPHYMAPEQATGGAVDLRADIYAFGVLAYEMLTGKVPFDGESSLAILLKHQKDLPVPPRELRPDLDIPASLQALVLRCLEKNRGERPQSMGEVGRALAACMAEQGLTSGPTPLVLAAIPPQARASMPQMQASPRPAARTGEMATEVGFAPLRETPVAPSSTEVGFPPLRDTPGEPAAVPAPAPEVTSNQRRPQIRIGDSRPGSGPNHVTDPVLSPSPRRTGLYLGVGGLAALVALSAGAYALWPRPAEVAVVKVPAPARADPPVPAPPTAPAPAAATPPPPATPAAVAMNPSPPVPVAAKPPPAPAPPSVAPVEVLSVPLGVQVLSDGHPLGTTPLRLALAQGESRQLRLVRPGYREAERLVRAGEGTVSVELQKLPAARVRSAPAANAPPAEPDGYRKVDDLKDPYGQ